MPGPDGCLELHTAADFDSFAHEQTGEGANRQRGRRLRRALYARSWDVELDKQGRILIPQLMRDDAALLDSVIVAGRGECLELWGLERWEEEASAVDRDYAANLEAQEQWTP